MRDALDMSAPMTATIETENDQLPEMHVSSIRVATGKSECLSVLVRSAEAKLCVPLQVDKSFIHIAASMKADTECTLAENGPFSVVLTTAAGNSRSAVLATIAARHIQSDVSVIQVKATHTETIREVAGVEVTGLEGVAVQLLKKVAIVPSCGLMGTFDMKGVASRPFAQFARAVAGEAGGEGSIQPRGEQGMRVWCHMPHSFKTLFHFNTKLISFIQSAYTDYNLPLSRGIVLNAALAYTSPLSGPHAESSAIIANTLETVPLSDPLPRDAEVHTRLSLKTTDGVIKVPVYRASEETRQLLAGVWGTTSLPAAQRVLYFFSRSNVPVLFACPLQRTLEDVRAVNTNQTAFEWSAPLATMSSLPEALRVLHYGQQVWFCDRAGQRENPQAWPRFCKAWLQTSSQLFPASKHILEEAAAAPACNSVAGLLCLLNCEK